MAETDIALYSRYLDLLGQEPAPPTTVDTLSSLVSAQLIRCPFENISKLYRARHLGIRRLPSLGEFLDGIERHGFGGTCYNNNHQFFRLLRHVGFDARFCGADMSAPDVHTVILVNLDGREYLIDVGYAAPFFSPIPRDLATDHVLRWGQDEYVLRPQDDAGRSRMDVHHAGKLVHSYLVNPEPRDLGYFDQIIQDSLADSATFMNAIRLERFRDNATSVSMRNRTLTLVDSQTSSRRELSDNNEVAAAIVELFGIPREIVTAAIDGLTDLRDVNE